MFGAMAGSGMERMNLMTGINAKAPRGRDAARRSRNQIVLVLLLVLVIENSIEDDDENEDEKEGSSQNAMKLRDSTAADQRLAGTKGRRARLEPASAPL
jgi:hypothetical protein